MLRWPFTLYAPARTSELIELVVAAVGAWRAPGDQPEQVGVVAAHQRQRLALVVA